jgi:hypothetical protein
MSSGRKSYEVQNPQNDGPDPELGKEFTSYLHPRKARQSRPRPRSHNHPLAIS